MRRAEDYAKRSRTAVRTSKRWNMAVLREGGVDVKAVNGLAVQCVREAERKSGLREEQRTAKCSHAAVI